MSPISKFRKIAVGIFLIRPIKVIEILQLGVLLSLYFSFSLSSCARNQNRKELTGEEIPDILKLEAQKNDCESKENIWDPAHEACLTPANYCLMKKDGSEWKAGRCVSPEELCIGKKDGSEWIQKHCHSKQEVCEMKGGQFAEQEDRCYTQEELCIKKGRSRQWTTGKCQIRSFLELCQDDQIKKDSDLFYTISVLKDLSASKSCLEAETWLKAQTKLTVYFPSENKRKLSDLSPLHTFTQLQEISLPNHKISDIEALESLTQLTNLDLENNLVNELKGIEHMFHLKKLNLGNNKILDLTALANLKEIKILYLWTNQISNITPLKELDQLEELHIRNNAIRDLSPLSALKQLHALALDYNPIAQKENQDERTCPSHSSSSVLKEFCSQGK